ncbi:MAG: ATPase P [Firmicutes bacterium]|nr:ATPase P [Bacillota bacterium]
MLEFDIPGRPKLTIENIVFDYNGTLATDGVLAPEIKESLAKLARQAKVYILTADTYGTVKEQCSGLDVNLKTFPKENAGRNKAEIVEELGAARTACIGNGFNDLPMCSCAALSIAVIGEEGCSGKLLAACDVIVKSISDAFELFFQPQRIKATLRN